MRCAVPITHPTEKIISDEAWRGGDGEIAEPMVDDLHRRHDSADVLGNAFRRMFDFPRCNVGSKPHGDFALQAKLKIIRRP